MDSKPAQNPCPRCNQDTFNRNDMGNILPAVTFVDGKPFIDNTKGLPVRIWYCRVCGYTEMRYQPINEMAD